MSINTTRSSERRSGEEVARLVRGAAGDDQRAWDALVEEFGAMVWAVARAHRLDHCDAADVAQATWLRLIEHLADLTEPSRVGAWLATTARRECLAVLRHARRNLLTAEETWFDREAPDPPAECDLVTTQRDAALWRCFRRLRFSDQALLRLLVADERLDYEQISAALAMPVGSIGPTRARALERLRGELERDGALELMAA